MNRVTTPLAAVLAVLACNQEPKHASAPAHPPPPRASVPVAKGPPPPAAVVVSGPELPDAPPPGEAEAAPAPVDPIGIEHEHRRPVDHLRRAEEMKVLGDLEGALAEARRGVYDDPLDDEALGAVARLGKLTREYKLAADAFERLAMIHEEDAFPYLQQARLLLDAKDPEGALLAAERAKERDEGNPEAFQLLGRAHLAQGQLSSAIDNFREAIALDPEHGHALNNLGFALLRTNQNEEAAEVLRRAAALLPEVAYVHNNLGIALERLGDSLGASEAYGVATSLSPKYVKAAVNKKRVARVERLQVPSPSEQQ